MAKTEGVSELVGQGLFHVLGRFAGRSIIGPDIDPYGGSEKLAMENMIRGGKGAVSSISQNAPGSAGVRTRHHAVGVQPNDTVRQGTGTIETGIRGHDCRSGGIDREADAGSSVAIPDRHCGLRFNPAFGCTGQIRLSDVVQSPDARGGERVVPGLGTQHGKETKAVH